MIRRAVLLISPHEIFQYREGRGERMGGRDGGRLEEGERKNGGARRDA